MIKTLLYFKLKLWSDYEAKLCFGFKSCFLCIQLEKKKTSDIKALANTWLHQNNKLKVFKSSFTIKKY